MKINLTVLTNLINYCKSQYPFEACGFLSGNNSLIDAVFPIENIAKNKRINFLMNPVQQLSTQKKIDDLGLKIIGIFHSHPQTSTPPSPSDIKQWLNYSWYSLIVSFEKGLKKPRWDCFKINPKFNEDSKDHLLLQKVNCLRDKLLF